MDVKEKFDWWQSLSTAQQLNDDEILLLSAGFLQKETAFYKSLILICNTDEYPLDTFEKCFAIVCNKLLEKKIQKENFKPYLKTTLIHEFFNPKNKNVEVQNVEYSENLYFSDIGLQTLENITNDENVPEICRKYFQKINAYYQAKKFIIEKNLEENKKNKNTHLSKKEIKEHIKTYKTDIVQQAKKDTNDLYNQRLEENTIQNKIAECQKNAYNKIKAQEKLN